MATGFITRFKGKFMAASASLFQFGNGGANFSAAGNLTQVAYGNTSGVTPAALAADNVLAVYSLPPNSFDKLGRLISVTAQGQFVNNANVKTAKIIYNPSTAVVGSTVGTGGTVIATTSAYSTSGATFGWQLEASICKYGALNSNTQSAQQTASIVGTVHQGVSAAANVSGTENASILIAVTGNAATASGDIMMTFFEVCASN
jgi:hypothetical protein